MKKFGFLMFLIVLMTAAFPKAMDASTYSAKIYLDGKLLNVSSGVKVENINGTVMVPIRLISENLGYSVKWNKASQKVTVENNNTKIEMFIGKENAIVDGGYVKMAKAPVLRSGTTLVPIRFVSVEMGLDIKWDNTKKAVYLKTNGSNKPASVNTISFSNNRLLVSVTGDFKPKVTKLTDPHRLVVDLENAEFSSNFNSSSRMSGSLSVTGNANVSSVRYSLFSSNPSTVRIVIDMKQAANYTLYGTGASSTQFIVDLNATANSPAPEPGAGSKKLIVIDAGHGAHDPGAISVNGKYEKDFALAVAKKIGNLLSKESGFDVVLTRSDDTFLELSERAKIANSLSADAFISIHANSGPSSASGTETYYERTSSKALADTIHKYLVDATGLKDRGVRYGNFHVIRETTMPAILLEVGFLSNKTDEAKLYSSATQDKVAAAVVKGLKEYF